MDLSITASEYNREFSIPEMITTYRGISSRLVKDAIFALLLLFFVLLYRDGTLHLSYLELTYNVETALLITFIGILLLFSIVSHLYKSFLLLNRIDVEVKLNYNIAGFVPKASNHPLAVAYKASHLTAFVLGDNLIADVGLLGARRMPTVRRLIWIQLVIFFFFIALFILNNEYIVRQTIDSSFHLGFILPATIGGTVLVMLAVKVLLFRQFFFLRSIALEKFRIFREAESVPF